MAGYRDLEAYKLAYQLALEIFEHTRSFPVEERYSLTDQIRRSSRGVVANLVEGYRKRQYPRNFAAKCAISDGEAAETIVWLNFAHDFGYLSSEQHAHLSEGYEAVGRMLGAMIAAPEKFAPRGR
jgi:four helix bundle protein